MQGTVGEPGSQDPDSTPSTWSCVANDASGMSTNQTYSSKGDLLPVRAARRLALALGTVSLPMSRRAASIFNFVKFITHTFCAHAPCRS